MPRRAALVFYLGEKFRLTVRDSCDQTLFMAEVYRDMEWTMQQQGFDYACDKRLYDRLRRCATTPCATATGSCSKCAPAWEGNWTWDCFLVFSWQGAGDEGLVVTVNYAPNQSQCYVRLPLPTLRGAQWRLQDLLGDAQDDRDGNDIEGADCIWTCRPGKRMFSRW